MKKPFLAFLFSFFLPGDGLAYLGKWNWALINFGAVLACGVALAFLVSEETVSRYGSYVAMGLGGGSGGLAQALAQQMNLKAQEAQDPLQPTRPQDGRRER